MTNTNNTNNRDAQAKANLERLLKQSGWVIGQNVQKDRKI